MTRSAGSASRSPGPKKLLASRAAELTTARDEATSATQAKNSFLSSTSHELRTPLNSILGFTQLLQMSELSDEDADSVERILGAGRHLLALINELIDIARIESGDLSLSLEPVLVRSVIEETSQLMAPIAAERSIRIIQQCAHPALAVQADRQRLSQVLVNLISNAVKYNHRGGSITISCREESAGQASIVVSDTGPGISPENIERIFVPFERLGAEHDRGRGHRDRAAAGQSPHRRHARPADRIERPRSGIGLHRHPPARPGPGPRARPRPRASRHRRPGRTPSAGAGISVLYIEDNPANIEVVIPVPEGQAEHQADVRGIWPGGLEAAARDLPDLILLDLHLPDLHGDQVLSELKAEPATAAIPVVSPVRRRLPRRRPPPARQRRVRLPHQAHRARRARQAARHLRRRPDQDQQAQPAVRIVPA